MIKTCRKCGKEKESHLFYKQPNSKDGRDSRCSECAKENAKRARNERIEHYREYDRKRGSRQDKGYPSEYRDRNPNKYRSHNMVNNNIRSGNLVSQPCEICGETKTVAHHDDYLMPLNVRWMCQAHHKQWHAKNGPGRNG